MQTMNAVATSHDTRVANTQVPVDRRIRDLAASLPEGDALRINLLGIAADVRRLADELEVARIELHNQDRGECTDCGDWFDINTLDAKHRCEGCSESARFQ